MQDRLDLHIWVDPVNAEDLVDEALEEPSEIVAQRVASARAIQLERFAKEKIFTNSQMDAGLLRKYCHIGRTENEFLKEIIRKLRLSGRAYSRILKISRTIADLAGNESISLPDIAEAVRFRSLDREREI